MVTVRHAVSASLATDGAARRLTRGGAVSVAESPRPARATVDGAGRSIARRGTFESARNLVDAHHLAADAAIGK